MTASNTDFLIVTTDHVPGAEIAKVYGLVRGSTVRAKHMGTDIVASLKNLVGGEMTGYSSLMAGSREQALDRVAQPAIQLRSIIQLERKNRFTFDFIIYAFSPEDLLADPHLDSFFADVDEDIYHALDKIRRTREAPRTRTAVAA